jgi:hypothetical protein
MISANRGHMTPAAKRRRSRENFCRRLAEAADARRSPLIGHLWVEQLRGRPSQRHSIGIAIVVDGGDQPRSAAFLRGFLENLRGLEPSHSAMRGSGVQIPSAPLAFPQVGTLLCDHVASTDAWREAHVRQDFHRAVSSVSRRGTAGCRAGIRASAASVPTRRHSLAASAPPPGCRAGRVARGRAAERAWQSRSALSLTPGC